MSTFNISPRSLFAVAGLCVALGFAIRFPAFGKDTDSPKTSAPRGDAPKSKVIALMEERRDVLEDRLEIIEALAKHGRLSPVEVFAARDDFFDAEYELAVDEAQRIAVLRRKIENAREYEALMKQQKREAKVSEAEVLTATARRLAVEIRLAKKE